MSSNHTAPKPPTTSHRTRRCASLIVKSKARLLVMRLRPTFRLPRSRWRYDSCARCQRRLHLIVARAQHVPNLCMSTTSSWVHGSLAIRFCAMHLLSCNNIRGTADLFPFAPQYDPAPRQDTRWSHFLCALTSILRIGRRSRGKANRRCRRRSFDRASFANTAPVFPPRLMPDHPDLRASATRQRPTAPRWPHDARRNAAAPDPVPLCAAHRLRIAPRCLARCAPLRAVCAALSFEASTPLTMLCRVSRFARARTSFPLSPTPRRARAIAIASAWPHHSGYPPWYDQSLGQHASPVRRYLHCGQTQSMLAGARRLRRHSRLSLPGSSTPSSTSSTTSPHSTRRSRLAVTDVALHEATAFIPTWGFVVVAERRRTSKVSNGASANITCTRLTARQIFQHPESQIASQSLLSCGSPAQPAVLQGTAHACTRYVVFHVSPSFQWVSRLRANLKLLFPPSSITPGRTGRRSFRFINYPHESPHFHPTGTASLIRRGRRAVILEHVLLIQVRHVLHPMLSTCSPRLTTAAQVVRPSLRQADVAAA